MPDPFQPTPSSLPQQNQVFLAFDYGKRKIGVAVGQSLTGTATPLSVVRNAQNDIAWDEIDKIVKEWQPDALILGLPLTETGENQETTDLTRYFARQLRKRYSLTVHFADERYSSRRAQARFKEQRRLGATRRKDAAKEDAVAAQIILEGWFEQHITRG